MKFSSLFVNTLVLLAVSSSLFGPSGGSGFLLVGADDSEDIDNASDAAAEKSGIPKEAYTPPANAEKFAFEAEVHKMLDIVVNSLYQNKDVFLRELISNASDALDKIRYLLLTESDKYKEGEEEIPLEVQIFLDEEAETLTIRDTGIGMTYDDMVKNLGTVARSGTGKFLEALKDSKNPDEGISQIGQFGVGFYSTFLVADRVTVASKNPQDPVQHVWEAENGAGDFVVYPDPRGNTLKRGTEITLHLKDDSVEYADEDRLATLAKHYSEFVTHKISLRKTETMDVEIEEDEEEDIDGEEKKDEDDLEVTEGDEDDDEKTPKTKKVTTETWEIMNSEQAIWTRDKDEVEDHEYQSFYKSFSGEYGNATSWTHFKAEGSINFDSILYLPEEVPSGYQLGNIDKIDGNMKLYVRKVLISDEFDLMPKYLGFVKGVVDSDDLPLNVNRETLQESKILKIIKKKLVRKTVDLIRSLAKEADKEDAEAEENKDGDEKAKKTNKYLTWYSKFSNNLKYGLIDDMANRPKLAKLLRYETSKSDGKMVSLEDYMSRLKEWQDQIYVLGGTDVETLRNSPFLEPLKEKDLEVIFMTDPVDEYVMQHLGEFEGKKIKQVSSDNIRFKDEDEDLIKRREKAYAKKFKPLIKWLSDLYGRSIMRVTMAKRGLGSIPAIVTSSEMGQSANMERIMKAQAAQQGVSVPQMSFKVLELNPRHPIVTQLLEAAPPDEKGDDEEEFKVSEENIDAANLLLDMALLNGGYPVKDVNAHNKRLTKVLQARYGLESLELEPQLNPPVEDDEPPEVGSDGAFNMDDFNMDDLDLDSLNLDGVGEEL